MFSSLLHDIGPMIVNMTPGKWYWGFRCQSCEAMVAFEEGITDPPSTDRPSRHPNIAIVTDCPNGHAGTWFVRDAERFQAP
jgi:hypothetical protein